MTLERKRARLRESRVYPGHGPARRATRAHARHDPADQGPGTGRETPDGDATRPTPATSPGRWLRAGRPRGRAGPWGPGARGRGPRTAQAAPAHVRVHPPRCDPPRCRLPDGQCFARKLLQHFERAPCSVVCLLHPRKWRLDARNTSLGGRTPSPTRNTATDAVQRRPTRLELWWCPHRVVHGVAGIITLKRDRIVHCMTARL